MEAVTAAHESASSNPDNVKSEDGSLSHGDGRASPPPNCAICLGTCRNKSFTDSCLHQFCFKCLLTWSKVKAVCPLCKQNFRSIIHNVRSNHQYEEYMVEQRQNDDTTEMADALARTFRYRTTITVPRHESIAIQQLLLQHYPMISNILPVASRRRRSPSLFRRSVYRHNLWARPLPDFTGRFRDCNPEFYRYNDSQMHRLMPWLSRELGYLLNDNQGQIAYVMSRILELLPQHHIHSTEFREAMRRYLGERTEHFLHELYCFASTPYDMTGYDRNVQYTTDTRVSTVINELVTSSDSEASVDSDIVMVSSSEPAEPAAGPSRARPRDPSVIPIETISHSDTDDDSEVMVVGYIKPPQDRTPEIVDLLGSDSDVIVQDAPPEPPTTGDAAEGRAAPLVKLSLKCHSRPRDDGSDSEAGAGTPPRPRRKRRLRSPAAASAPSTASTRSAASTHSTHSTHSAASTPDTRRTTPSPATPPTPATGSSYSGRTSTSTSASSSSVSSSTSSTSSSTPLYSETSTDFDEPAEERRRALKRKIKRKMSSERSRKRCKRSKSRSRRKGSRVSQRNLDKTSKRKSYSGKGVKSSKKRSDRPEVSKLNTDESQPNFEQPVASTSGTSCMSAESTEKNYSSTRPSHESKRLKSVVRVIKSKKTVNVPTFNRHENVLHNTVEKPCTSRVSPDLNSKVRHSTDNTNPSATPPLSMHHDTSDSEDNLPLNLTIQK